MKDSEIFNVSVVIGAVIFLIRGVQGTVSSSLLRTLKCFMVVWWQGWSFSYQEAFKGLSPVACLWTLKFFLVVC